MNSYMLAHLVLALAYVIEIAQYFNIVSILGLQHIDPVRIIFGATFDWLDLLAYTVGWGCILFIERCRTKLENKKASR